MPRWAMGLAYIRSLILAFRIIAFEKTGETVLLLWAGPALITVLVFFMYSVISGIAAMGVTLLLYYGLRRWALTSRFRLIRPGDRIEYAKVTENDEGHRQQFEAGIVHQRLTREDAERTGKLKTDLMGMSKWFYLVSSDKQTRIVPLEWIVSIEFEQGS